MKTELSLFNFNNQAIRIMERSGEPWFVAADVCDALEIGNPTMALKRLDQEDLALITIEGITRGNNQVNLINESGLYSLILTSRKEEAKRFKKWVTSEVLPSIRKTGSYGSRPQEVNNAALQADKLAERLIETTHPELRRILWAGLDRYCKMLGIATPALEAMRPLTPPEPAELVQFWATVNTLQDACGVRLNHSRHPHVMALNLNECARAALVHGLTMAPLHVLKPLLRQGQRYAMLGIKDVSSRHTQRTVHCWLFAPEQPANLPASPPS